MTKHREQTGSASSRVGAKQAGPNERQKERNNELGKSHAGVLMQRVIALNGVIDRAQNSPAPRVLVAKVEPFAPSASPVKAAPPQLDNPQIDLAATALEWSPQHIAATPQPAPAPITTTTTTTAIAEEPPTTRFERNVADVKQVQATPSVRDAKDLVDAHWATYSSISMRPYDEVQLPQSLLTANIEDAATKQYHPARATQPLAAAASITDLASLDLALASAGVPEGRGFELPPAVPAAHAPPPIAAEPAAPEPVNAQMLVVPATLVWTVLGVFAVCALALAYFVAMYLLH